MIYFPLHKYYVFNGEIRPNTEFISNENAGSIYEVLRVIKGVPLFYEEHLNRFFHSAKLAGREINFSKKQIIQFFNILTEQNHIYEGNLLISLKTDLYTFFIPHKYPEESWYISGVPCGVLKAERKNPNIKIFQTNVRKKADHIMEKQGLYEVMLVDNLGRITEGSRSNFFFIKKGRLYTSPGDYVLRGITREKVILLANKQEIPLTEKSIFYKDLYSYESVFITGTSSKILPVSEIENIKFDPLNNITQLLRKEYNELIDNQILNAGIS